MLDILLSCGCIFLYLLVGVVFTALVERTTKEGPKEGWQIGFILFWPLILPLVILGIVYSIIGKK